MFKIEIDDGGVSEALMRLIQAGEDLSPTLDAIGRLIKTRVQQGFVAGVSPYGDKWAPPKQREGKPLIKNAYLKNSIDYQVEGDSVEIGTSIVYGAIHNFGGTIERGAYSSTARLRTDAKGNLLRQEGTRRAIFAKKSHQRVRSVRYTTEGFEIHIPQRQWLPTDGLPEDWRDDVLDVVAQTLKRAIGEG